MEESENNGITVVEMSYGRVTMRVDKLLLDLMTRGLYVRRMRALFTI